MKRMLKILFVVGLAFFVSPPQAPGQAKADAKNGAVDWHKLLAEVRERFARSQEPVLQQTRIDRAYFDLNADDPDQPPFLKFTGVCLRTAHDNDKQTKETLIRELNKVKLPNTEYVLQINEIQIHDSPIYKLQSAAAALHKTDPDVNVFFERATYGPDGGLQLHILYLRKVKTEKIARLYEKERLPIEIFRLPGVQKTKPPSVIRRDYDWDTVRKELRRQFADDSDALLNRTRLDEAHLEYTADKKDVQFHVDGVCIHPPGLVDPAKRAQVWKSRIHPRMPGVAIPKATVLPRVAGVNMLANPSIHWQNRLSSDEKHDGIYFQLAQFNALGRLHWIVKLANDTQRAAVAKVMEEKPAPADLGPNAEKSPQFQPWSWKDVLPQAQARLAEGDFVLHRARLDRMFLKYDDPERADPYLHIDGVSLHPTEVEAADKQRKQLERALDNLLPMSLEHKWNSERMRFLTSPIYALQTEVNARNVDGLLFADGSYDKAGKLHLHIAVATDSQPDTARDILKAAPMPDGAIGPRDDKAAPKLDFTFLPWDEIFDQMQRWLARDNDTLLRKTRVDRGFFSYPASKIGPDLNLAAVGIYAKKDAYQSRLKKRFEVFTRLYLADQLRAGPVAAVPIVQNVDNPAPIVQAKVSQTAMLDGVRLDDASFNGAGKLLFHGIWIGKEQEFWLEKLVQETLTPDHAALKQGIHWGSMQDFDSPALLLRMRTWVADQDAIDEVWLERFYFDAGGKVRVAGFSTRPQDKEKAVTKLPDFLPKFESKKLPSIDPPGPAKEPEKQFPPSMEVKVANLRDDTFILVTLVQEPKDDNPIQLEQLTNIGQYLRDNIPKVTKCDGLRIDRCFYDSRGVFRIEGLADRVLHTAELKAFLEDPKAPFDRSRQLGKGWSEGRQTVIALRPMMIRLDENLPSLSEFDGLTLERAHHDPKNRLVFTGQAIGAADAKELAGILKRLLDTHPRWRLRTSAGVVIDITERQKPNLDLARKNVMRALHLLQVNIGEARVEPLRPTRTGDWWTHAWPFDPKLPRVRPTDDDYERGLQWLDAALLHNPNDVLAWYLRGYLLQTKKRTDLSLRDFRRMAAAEIADPELRHKRILDLELVQGALRQSAFRIEQDAILQVSEGWTVRELRESPAARDTMK